MLIDSMYFGFGGIKHSPQCSDSDLLSGLASAINTLANPTGLQAAVHRPVLVLAVSRPVRVSEIHPRASTRPGSSSLVSGFLLR
jgi:hypothetical protein